MGTRPVEDTHIVRLSASVDHDSKQAVHNPSVLSNRDHTTLRPWVHPDKRPGEMDTQADSLRLLEHRLLIQSEIHVDHKLSPDRVDYSLAVVHIDYHEPVGDHYLDMELVLRNGYPDIPASHDTEAEILV